MRDVMLVLVVLLLPTEFDDDEDDEKLPAAGLNGMCVQCQIKPIVCRNRCSACYQRYNKLRRTAAAAAVAVENNGITTTIDGKRMTTRSSSGAAAAYRPFSPHGMMSSGMSISTVSSSENSMPLIMDH